MQPRTKRKTLSLYRDNVLYEVQEA